MLRNSNLFRIGILLVSLSLFCASNGQRINVTAKRFEFAPNEITVKRGEKVTLVVQSQDVTHGLKLKDFGVNTDLPKGKGVEVSFTPTQAGTYVGQCSHFCGSGHGRMKLTVHVKE